MAAVNKVRRSLPMEKNLWCHNVVAITLNGLSHCEQKVSITQDVLCLLCIKHVKKFVLVSSRTVSGKKPFRI